MVENKRVVKTSTGETARKGAIPIEKRRSHMFEDGQQCRQPRWAGKEVCYQHDKRARVEKKLKEGSRQGPGFTVAQLQQLLAMAMGQVLFGKMPVGQAYALGYLAQQSLAAHGVRAKEQKLDVKHFWEMVDLGATFERAAELAKEKKRQKKEAEEAEEAEEEEEAEEQEKPFTTEVTENTEERETVTGFTAEEAENTEGTEEAREGEDEEGIRESP